MKKKLFLSVICLLFASVQLRAQVQMYLLNDTTDGRVFTYNAAESAVGVMDNGGSGVYTEGDYSVTISSSCSDSYRFCFILTELDIDCQDTLFIYDGPDVDSPIRAMINNCTGHYVNELFFVSPTNTSGMLTIRFKSSGNPEGRQGFTLSADCNIPCERIEPVIDSVFYRTRNGVVYDSAYLRQVPVIDTLWTINENGDTLGIERIDTNYFTGAHLCVGDGVIFHGHGKYTYEHGYYTPSDATTEFVWDMANEGDTIRGVGVTSILYNDYQRTGCYDMVLSITDGFGCPTQIYTSVKVRTSVNPIKTLFSLSHICNNASLMVNMGYDGENATLTLRKVETNETVSKTYEVRTFIPDGPYCEIQCYTAPVDFSEFPESRKVQTAEDICSICINMEHTYMGDISVFIVCPTQQQAPLFYGAYDPARQHLPEEELTADGAGQHGSLTDLGCPLRNFDGDPVCDSLPNPFGVGLDYCFSRNSDYTLVTGDPAGSIVGRPSGHHYITCTHTQYQIQVSDSVLPMIPPYFTNGGGTSPTFNGSTKRPSNHENKTDYYIPYTDFSELIGCPLNGQWSIKVCDQWRQDNGWVFSWSMDICGVSQDQDCKYEVGIDSLVWRPNRDTSYYDYELGHYRGLVVERESPSVSYLMTPDTAGTFPIDVMVYDEFGCIWQDSTAITSFWTPEPSLGPDTALCGDTQMPLDATDRHMNTQNYTFTWEPFGQDTPTIITQTEPSGDVRYVARVINTQDHGYKKCERRDTINVRLRKQPLPSFNPTPFVLEGCAPLTITFDNNSTNADFHKWIFGDGITSELRSPTHSYDVGVFDVKYYATSADGCVDSLIFDRLVASYSAPKASFAWEPVYPSVLNPEVHLSNLTTPQSVANKYFWEIQYNLNNPISVETVTEETVDFDFSTYAENENIAGNYTVRLITRTDNMAPSGNIVYCRDTAENTILVINDFIQFPNVVTPNGDGINDRFVIRNLIEGMGYPTNALYIYNKWGSCVYKKENISTYDDFWDPSNVPSGTYFYRFTARGYNGNIEHSGAIEVIK